MGSLDEFSAAASLDAPTDRSVSEYIRDNAVAIDLTGDELEIELLEPAYAPVFLTPRAGLLGATRAQLAIKRTVDVIGAAIGMVLLAPLFLVIAIAVSVTSPGPVFYRTPRVGKDSVPFTFVKFRTMFVGAEAKKAALREFNEADGPIFKMKDDPRITPLGRLLRKTSLDELPQLMHVLSGKMSLVGVRPQLIEEVENYTEVHAQRLLVKPGLTCIWQVSGRSDLDFETWMRMDLEYIATWTPALDFKLLMRTFGAVFSGRGAY